MKYLNILLYWLLSFTLVQAQRVFPMAEVPTFAGRDTVVNQTYVELDQPFFPQQPNLKATVLFHVLDQGHQAYSGYVFRIEYKDFATGTWLTYQDFETVVDYNDGTERIMPLLHQLPNGYYRAWAQCLRTKRVGLEPFILDVTRERAEPLQFTLIIPQQQTWITGK